MFAEITGALVSVEKGVSILRSLNILKDAKGEGQILAQKAIDDLAKDIDQAKKALDHEKFKLATAVGYPLCRCTFPPQIVTKQPEGRGYICENCGDTHADPKTPGVWTIFS